MESAKCNRLLIIFYTNSQYFSSSAMGKLNTSVCCIGMHLKDDSSYLPPCLILYVICYIFLCQILNIATQKIGLRTTSHSSERCIKDSLKKSSYSCTFLSAQQPTFKQPVTAVTLTSEHPVLKDYIL